MAGTCVLRSLALSQVHSVSWLWFTAFVGANLFQSALTYRAMRQHWPRRGNMTGRSQEGD